MECGKRTSTWSRETSVTICFVGDVSPMADAAKMVVSDRYSVSE